MTCRPTGCAVARLPFVLPAYTSLNYTLTSYKLAIPTQLQLLLAVIALSLGKLFRFLDALDTGYLSSAIDPPSGNATTRKTSISDSSKGLVPSDYGHTRCHAAALPLESLSDRRPAPQGNKSDFQIGVSTEVMILHEPYERFTPSNEA